MKKGWRTRAPQAAFRPLAAAFASGALSALAVVALALTLSDGSLRAPAGGDVQERQFTVWLEDMKARARQRQISEPVLESAFAEIELVMRILELDKKQWRSNPGLEHYLNRAVSADRISRGRRYARLLDAMLDDIEARYGVQRRFLLALWGVESDFGVNSGGFSVMAALASLAFEGRRRAFFEEEMLKALEILEQRHIEVAAMRGSWAGAMGQVQFMPSTFLAYAADYDGDGARNIWTNVGDALASAANFLASFGWDDTLTWGREVTIPPCFDYRLAGREDEKWKTLAAWQKLGVRRLSGKALPRRDVKAALIFPDPDGQRAFLVYSNFEKLMLWNRSDYFGVAVGALADSIKDGRDS